MQVKVSKTTFSVSTKQAVRDNYNYLECLIRALSHVKLDQLRQKWLSSPGPEKMDIITGGIQCSFSGLTPFEQHPTSHAPSK